MWWRTCFRAHWSDVMRYESHLSRESVFGRDVINKSCANCIYSICQLVLHSGVVCCTSHIPNAELGFTVWCSQQLRGMQLHRFLPEGEGNWKESGNGKSHAWEAGVHETPTQGAVCCLPGTNWGSHTPVPKEKGQALGLGVSWGCWLGLLNGLKLWSHYWQCIASTFGWHMASTQAEREI